VRVPLSWLHHSVDPGLSAEQLASTLTLGGLVVDAIHRPTAGIRGVIVATLPGKDRRDYLASEARQRSSLHQVPAFGVLVLHGSQRRPIAEGAMRLLERLATVCVLPPPGHMAWLRWASDLARDFRGHHGGRTPEETRTYLAALEL